MYLARIDAYDQRGPALNAISVTNGNALTEADARDAERRAGVPREAGAVIIAKSNMHEFAYGITTLGSRFGQTRNPYALDRNPGGSSGGTGAAIAANFA